MAGYPSSPNEGSPEMNLLLSGLRSSSISAKLGTSATGPGIHEQLGGTDDHLPSSTFFSQSPPHPYHDASVSSPPLTLPLVNQQSRHSSINVSPFGKAASPNPFGQFSGGNTTANLLGLLKFSEPDARPSSQPKPIGPPQTVSREPSIIVPSSGRGGTPDLLATLMGSARSTENSKQVGNFEIDKDSATPSPVAGSSRVPSDTQALLLKLLNRPKPPQKDSIAENEPANSAAQENKSILESDVVNVTATLKETTLGKRPQSESDEGNGLQGSTTDLKSKKGLFTYVNPFDHLAASAPSRRSPSLSKPNQVTPVTPVQILKRETGERSELKRKLDERTPFASPEHVRRKVASTPSTTSPLVDDRTPIEALIGIGLQQKSKLDVPSDRKVVPKGKETVSQALGEVGDQVDKQVEKALAHAEFKESDSAMEKDLLDVVSSKTDGESKSKAIVAAVTPEEILEKEVLEREYEDIPASHSVKEAIDETAQKGWESDDMESNANMEENDSMIVKVYNFTLKPFTLLTLSSDTSLMHPGFRDDSILDIARLKKDFDQVDRTLATATTTFIMYGMSKNGGIRVIRQQDGRDVKLFTETRDRVFNIAASTSMTNSTETVIGTGVSGTVYWAPIKGPDGDYVEGTNPEKSGLSLPPIQPSGEELAGGVLKTRARKSSSHPEFFAVGRGKLIHIIWPSIITTQGYLKEGRERIVDTDKYLSQRSLKINTGKAGKDFTFCHDDTTIVSLDKAGRVKFWDVRTLTSLNRTNDLRFPAPEQIQPVEIKEPLLTLLTTQANEKSWPTSVMFVDKLRPYVKGGAQRYLLVGMKQNHSLQLWDLLIGRPVQELHLPHDNESDAVCSIAYHPGSSMIVIGHPTRNSIYFVHLSAPRYNLTKFPNQADFTEKLARRDPSLPKVEATAVMSGIREYSFAKKGLLRSVDLLQSPTSSSENDDDPLLFELYAMHSKGVTCLAIRNRDLGWNAESRVIHADNAEEVGLVTMTMLKNSPPLVANESASNSPSSSASQDTSSKAMPKDTVPKVAVRKVVASNGHSPMPVASKSASSSSYIDVKKEPTFDSATNGVQDSAFSSAEKKGKKAKKAASSVNVGGQNLDFQEISASATTAVQTARDLSKDVSVTGANDGRPPVHDQALKDATTLSSISGVAAQPLSTGLSKQDVDEAVRKVEEDVSSRVAKLFSHSVEQLYERFDSDKKVQAVASDAKQEALLRVVSSTLTDNLDKTLAANITRNIEDTLLPALAEAVTKSLDKQFGSKLSSQLQATLPKELHKVLPDAIGKALQNPEHLKIVSDSLVKVVAKQLNSTVEEKIVPNFASLAVQHLKIATDGLQRQRHEDSIKIQQLSNAVEGMAAIISDMAAAQSKFQAEILKLRDIESRDRGQHSRATTSSRAVSTVTPSQIQLDEMIAGINTALESRRFEEALMLFLQSSREQEIFERYLFKVNPSFLQEVSSLMLLSLASTVTVQLDSMVLFDRLNWLEHIVKAFQSAARRIDDETREVLPKIISVVINRLEIIMVRISQLSAQDPLLKRISHIVIAFKVFFDSNRLE